jgi:hypothetical protein
MTNLDSELFDKKKILTVHGLVCHDHVDMAITCFQSLLKFSADPLEMSIHDDGTLTAEDIDKLKSHIPRTHIISRSEGDDLINPQLKKFPNIYKYRCNVPHAIKLIDIALLSPENIAFCDSDILFLRPFRDLFQLGDRSAAIFMKDYLEAYSVFPWHLIGKNKLLLPSKINSGLFYMKREVYDLDFIEWFLGQQRFQSKPLHKMEQTCWAALGYRSGMEAWDPQQIVLMRPYITLNSEMIAGHFVKEIRNRLKLFADEINDPQLLASEPISVRTVAAEPCDVKGLAMNHFKRQSNRIRSHRKKLIGI